MTNFIELTGVRDGKVLFSTNHITNVQESTSTEHTIIVTTDCSENDMYYTVKESYAKVLELLGE